MARIYIRDQSNHDLGKWFDMDDYRDVYELLNAIVAMMERGTSPLGSWERAECEGISPALVDSLNIAQWLDYSRNVRVLRQEQSPDYADAYFEWANHPDNHSRATDAVAFEHEYEGVGQWDPFIRDLVRGIATKLIPAHLRNYFDYQKFEAHLKSGYYTIDRFIFKHV